MVLSLSPRAAGELAPGAGGYLVGREFSYVVGPRDTLRALTSRYGVAVSVLATANHLKQYSLLWPGEILQIDDRHVPQTLTNGILINIPQRLLFVFAAGHVISCYPVALGRPDWPTPTAEFEVTAMQQHPPWIVLLSIQRAMAWRGENVVAWAAPGPHNPLGRYAIFLDAPGYLIHGTDRPFSIFHFVAGVVLVSDSAALTRQIASALAARTSHLNASELPSGLNAGVLSGITGVVLGILAILQVAPQTLIAVAAIVFGAAVLFDFAARSQLHALRMTTGETPEQSARLALATASSTSTAAIFTGVGLVTLGILALAGIAGEVLIAVALLGLGAYVLLEDAAMVERLTSFFGQ